MLTSPKATLCPLLQYSLTIPEPSPPEDGRLSRLTSLAVQIAGELGCDFPLLLRYEVAFRKSLHFFDPDTVYQTGQKDRARRVPFEEGLFACRREAMWNPAVALDEAEAQRLYTEIADRLLCRPLLAEFNQVYRSLLLTDDAFDRIYAAGYEGA